MASTSGFELEEALFSTAPVGIHCVDSRGTIVWANRTELNFLGLNKLEEYVGRYVLSFVYSDKQGPAASNNNAGNNILAGGSSGAGGGNQQQNQPQQADNNAGQQQEQSGGGGNSNVNQIMTADDKTLYKEVLKRVVTSGSPISEIPVRFVTRSGTVIHLLLDCDGVAIPMRGGTRQSPSYVADDDATITAGNSGQQYYYRFFTRDDTARRIQEMRSNVLFQETNRSLQMLDNFMNRSMQMMRAPLNLMEKACNLVSENIEDIDEVVRRNANASAAAAAAGAMMMAGHVNNNGPAAPPAESDVKALLNFDLAEEDH